MTGICAGLFGGGAARKYTFKGRKGFNRFHEITQGSRHPNGSFPVPSNLDYLFTTSAHPALVKHLRKHLRGGGSVLALAGRILGHV